MTRSGAWKEKRPAFAAGGDELQLLEHIRQGDPDAFERLYRLYRPRLSRFLLTLTRRPPLVEEVVDDTLMVVWQRGDSFNGSSRLSTWIFAIAYRKAMKALRRQDLPVEDPEDDERAGAAPGPDEAYGRQRLHDLLLDAMRSLSPEHRAVVDLTYFHELGYREIAGILGCPLDTVKTRMFHARRHLRRRMAGNFADWV